MNYNNTFSKEINDELKRIKVTSRIIETLVRLEFLKLDAFTRLRVSKPGVNS